MAAQRTLTIIKPDGVQRGLVGPILGRLEARGLKIVGVKLVQVSQELAERHYAEHRDKPFFAELVEFIGSGDVVVAKVSGPEAISVLRALMGATDPAKADRGTIRGDYGKEITQNLVHGSDSSESARRELELFFPG